MPHWPPQPCVEDEVTSLEHEQIPSALVKTLKSDDDPAVSRGTVDQYPILVDTDNQRTGNKQDSRAGSQPTAISAETNSSDDSTGPTTPPPLYRTDARRSSPPNPSKNVAFQDSTMTSSLAPITDSQARGRPHVSRIDTDLGADLEAMATGTRRAPSPYSYTRPSASASLPSSQPHTKGSSVKSSSSGNHIDLDIRSQYNSRLPADTRAVLSDEPDVSGRQRRRRRSRSRTRSRSQHREPTSRYERLLSTQDADVPSAFESRQPQRRSTHDVNDAFPSTTPARYPADRQTYTPPQSRRQSRGSYPASAGEEQPATRLLRSARDEHNVFESPYTSSAEESSKNGRYRRERPVEARTRRRRSSAQQRERPRSDNFSNLAPPRATAASVGDERVQSARQNSRRSYHEQVTPLTADASKSMEDYFERAFKDNENRKGKPGQPYRTSGSVVASPMTSPPRTPRSERQVRDYFEVDSTSQRPAQRPQPPSADDNQLSGLRPHVSLLSAATTGAALAARTSGDPSQAGQTGSTPRSRRPSPVLEEKQNLQRSSSFTYPDIQRTMYGTSQAYGRNPEPRNSMHEMDAPPAVPRSASYSGQDAQRYMPVANAGSPYDTAPRHPYNANHVATGTARPPPYVPPVSEVAPQPFVLRLPPCPRSIPVSGYHDWYSVKEMSNLDFCPTCMKVLRTTHFSHLFVPSLPRPYNEPSVCAMSKPWLRIAFMRAFRQGLPDLWYMNDLSVLPSGTRPCAGDQADLRIWFDLIDPATKEPVPSFVACSACARAIDKIFPELQHLLERPKPALNQEKVCSLRANSKHFPIIIDQFEQTAARVRERGRRPIEIQPLVNTIRKACRFQECSRDKLLPIRTWHFMPDLPEFTICEECYEEVVWPLSDKPIARDICKTTKIVPIRRNPIGNAGISCQLYSDRMRKLFWDAVATRNFAQLRDTARTRQATQQRLHEMNRLYEADQKYGIDRRGEIEKNNLIWRSLE